MIDKSLLLRAESLRRDACPLYQMLETVRAYAARELAAAGERDDALEGLVRYCVGEASLAAEGLVGPAQVDWLDRVHDDLESYRGALTWLIERGRSAEASDIAWGLMFFWLIRGHAAEGLWWYEQILNLPSLPPAAESRALLGAAVMLYTQGRARARTRGAHTRARARPRRRRPEMQSLRLSRCSGSSNTLLAIMDAARDRLTSSVEGFRATANSVGHRAGIDRNGMGCP